jgi:hypothetical protein
VKLTGAVATIDNMSEKKEDLSPFGAPANNP